MKYPFLVGFITGVGVGALIVMTLTQLYFTLQW